MKKLVFVAALLAGMAFVPQTASASTIFDFTFKGFAAVVPLSNVVDWGVVGSGSITGDLINPVTNEYRITAGSLNVAGGSYSGNYSLYPWYPNGAGFTFSPSGLWTYDNLFYYPGVVTSGDLGLLFRDAGGREVNLWGPDHVIPDTTWGIGFSPAPTSQNRSYGDLESFAVTGTRPVPEPATISLLGLGLVGLARAARRKKQ